MLLIELLTEYARERLNVEPKSVQIVRYSINNLGVFLGREPEISDLTKANILDSMAFNSASGRSPRTCNHHRGNLILLWNFAAERKHLADPPKIAKRKEPRRDPVAWTLAEIAKLYSSTDLVEGRYGDVSKSLTWKIAIAMAWDTATRIGALRQALVADVNLHSGLWLCRAETIKGKREDEVKRLHPTTLELIRRSLVVPRRLLWPFPYDAGTATRHLGKILDLAGLPNDRRHKFHCIRKTAESYAAAEKGIEWAAAAVGHSVEVARRNYISKAICTPPALIEALPRPF
jgi:integrase